MPIIPTFIAYTLQCAKWFYIFHCSSLQSFQVGRAGSMFIRQRRKKQRPERGTGVWHPLCSEWWAPDSNLGLSISKLFLILVECVWEWDNELWLLTLLVGAVYKNPWIFPFGDALLFYNLTGQLLALSLSIFQVGCFVNPIALLFCLPVSVSLSPVREWTWASRLKEFRNYCLD